MQSLWFGIAVAAVVVLTRQSRAATPAGLAPADGPKLCEQAIALTRLGEVGLEAARTVEALAQTARANAAAIEALLAAASQQGEGDGQWEQRRKELRRKQQEAANTALDLTLLATKAINASVTSARTGADLGGFLLTLAAVGTGGPAATAKSCLDGTKQTGHGGKVKTNAHYILKETCADHFKLGRETSFERLKAAVMKEVKLEAGGSGGGTIGNARDGSADECALLALSKAADRQSNGLLLDKAGDEDERAPENGDSERTHKKITLGSCIEIRADGMERIKWVDGTIKHGANNKEAMLGKIGAAVQAAAKAKGPCAQHTGACDTLNVKEALKQLSGSRASKPDPANASKGTDTATRTSAQNSQETTRTAEQNRGRGETHRSPTATAQVTEAVLRKTIAHAPLGLVALMTVRHATPH
ncbi:hypothetical protein, conserved in T. vivax [Trypanosoma vivax Y486]|uniref:Uncharacterized protein n=1 Tax=Trypanosoma vivax (strain Y486) TaxID=1055687 RepID=F9WUK9_TRYVY|nr:hypothetical protein, conserved in T. vivax [Trypanosoma vivax Y486]|eukprot:CCD21258.1 hypothetical protein, conserved in T. vivax [Trypanosoma vivax Y486]